MKAKVIFVICMMFFLCSCKPNTPYISYIEFPITSLANRSTSTVTVDVFYYNKVTNSEVKKTLLLEPNTSDVLLEWVYPNKIIISDDTNTLGTYIGKPEKFVSENIESNSKLVFVSVEYLFDDNKYSYENIPQEMYDFDWIGLISENDKFCGVNYKLELKE